MKSSMKKILYIVIVALLVTAGFQLGRVSTQRRLASGDQINSLDSDEYEDIFKNVDSLIEIIDKNYLRELDKDNIDTGIYKGLLSTLDDPYSVYYDQEEFQSLMEDTQGEFGGIGIQVSANQNGYIEVIAPIKDTPGDKAGIQPGDFITHINDQPFSADQLDEAVKVMRGEPGQDVNVTLLRNLGSDQETINLTITREIIVIESVHYQMLEDNIGYLQLSGFQENSDEDFVAGIEALKEEGAEKLVLDLRNNPGGLLDVVTTIGDYLMDEGTLISVRYKDESKNEIVALEDGKEDIPMTVLINKGSASASEVLAGALQDNDRATLVGQTSFGKGVIQQIYPVFVDGQRQGMKLTIAEFYTPDGNVIQDQGISPDHEVILEDDVTEIGIDNLENDTQLQKAIDLLK